MSKKHQVLDCNKVLRCRDQVLTTVKQILHGLELCILSVTQELDIMQNVGQTAEQFLDTFSLTECISKCSNSVVNAL